MYTVCCGGASLLSSKSYKSSCEHETLLMETALAIEPTINAAVFVRWNIGLSNKRSHMH